MTLLFCLEWEGHPTTRQPTGRRLATTKVLNLIKTAAGSHCGKCGSKGNTGKFGKAGKDEADCNLPGELEGLVDKPPKVL